MLKFLKRLSLVIVFYLIALVLITITTGPWLLNLHGKFFIWLGNSNLVVAKFLNFFGIGG